MTRVEEETMKTINEILALPRGELLRVLALGIAVLLEGAAILSVVLNSEYLVTGKYYPNVISVLLFVMPTVIGLLSARLVTSLVLSALPWWITSVIYLAEFGAVWNIDLFQLGVLAGRVAGMIVLLFALSLFGWAIRRTFVKGTRVAGSAS
jgi:hypothetical protein